MSDQAIRWDMSDTTRAIISASVRRLHPIVITTVTTILGLLALIIFQDPLFYGMASVIAFGLAVGTLLTLGVVPVLCRLQSAKSISRFKPFTRRW